MKKLALILLVFGLAAVALGQPPIAWTQSLRFPGNQGANAVRQTPDGGYVIATGSAGAMLVKTNPDGDTLWTRRPDNFGTEIADIELTSDHGFVLAGKNAALCVIKTDSLGNEQWRYEDAPNVTNGSAVLPTWDGGYVVAGNIVGDGSEFDLDIYVVRLNAEGDTLWTRRLGNSWFDRAFDVIQTTDHDYIVIGEYQPDVATHCGYAARLHDNGATAWARTNCASDGPIGRHAACIRSDGHFVTAGYHFIYGLGFHYEDVFVEAISPTGVRDRTYLTGEGGVDIAYGIAPAQGNGVIVAGTTSTAGLTGQDMLLVGLDSELSELWRYRLDEGGFETAKCITQTSDGGYLVGGTIRTGSSDGVDIRLVKLCPEGNPAGHLSLIGEDSIVTSYRLIHESGSLDHVYFPNTEPGATGSVGGQASANWQALPNGDGNNGDSVVFVAAVPLTVDSVDTFRLSQPQERCFARWVAGCRTDSVPLSWRGSIDSVNFSGGVFGWGVWFWISAVNEVDVTAYEILRGSGSFFTLVGSFPAENGPGPHEYSYFWSVDYPGNQQYLLAAVDGHGCRHEFRNHLISYGHGFGVDEQAPHKVNTFSLSSYPNPFNPTTTLAFTLPKARKATLAVYDLLGREVAVLSDQVWEAGEHKLRFNGSALPSGIYFARMQSGEFTATQKLLLLK